MNKRNLAKIKRELRTKARELGVLNRASENPSEILKNYQKSSIDGLIEAITERGGELISQKDIPQNRTVEKIGTGEYSIYVKFFYKPGPSTESVDYCCFRGKNQIDCLKNVLVKAQEYENTTEGNEVENFRRKSVSSYDAMQKRFTI